jgi:cation diffusion facilitator CzcD-associated flavoprotein CzcO
MLLRGDEILEPTPRIARHYDLYRSALLHVTVAAASWLSAVSQWEVRTTRGNLLRGRFLVRANGPMSKPRVPADDPDVRLRLHLALRVIRHQPSIQQYP